MNISNWSTMIGFAVYFLAVLLLPLISKKVEENSEIFYFLAGIMAVGLAILTGESIGTREIIGAFEVPVMTAGLPIGIIQIMLIGGSILRFRFIQIERLAEKMTEKVGSKGLIFLIVLFSGLLAPLATVFVAAVLAGELISILQVSRELKIKIAVISCFSMGIGSSLTPIGEPLAAIAIAVVGGNFFFLFDLLWLYIMAGIVAVAVISLFFRDKKDGIQEEEIPESIKEILERTSKVYVFIVGLVLLGRGMSILAPFFASVSPVVVYWLNLVSAFIDGGALVPIEIGPLSDLFQIKSAVMSLLVAGVMLVPGSIPNIIVATRLGISNKEWAKIGVPLGFAMMLGYFVWLFLV